MRSSANARNSAETRSNVTDSDKVKTTMMIRMMVISLMMRMIMMTMMMTRLVMNDANCYLDKNLKEHKFGQSKNICFVINL